MIVTSCRSEKFWAWWQCPGANRYKPDFMVLALLRNSWVQKIMSSRYQIMKRRSASVMYHERDPRLDPLDRVGQSRCLMKCDIAPGHWHAPLDESVRTVVLVPLVFLQRTTNHHQNTNSVESKTPTLHTSYTQQWYFFVRSCVVFAVLYRCTLVRW